MDLINALCRLLANERRLRLHRTVWRRPGLTVTALADAVHTSQPRLSSHLRLMADFALVDLRPSGRHVHVHLPARGLPSNDFARAVHLLLVRTWTIAEDANPTHAYVWDWLGTAEGELLSSPEEVTQPVIGFLTAYTHLRRLLLLRCLRDEGPLPQDRMAEKIGMSPSAASRQLQKLRRRGLVEVAPSEEGRRWRLIRSPQAGLQKELHRLVMAAL